MVAAIAIDGSRNVHNRRYRGGCESHGRERKQRKLSLDILLFCASPTHHTHTKIDNQDSEILNGLNGKQELSIY